MSNCPVLAPGQPRTATRMTQVCGADLASMIQVAGVPPEYVAAVCVRTVAAPNSAVRWANYCEPPSCDQVFFFDTRRPVLELHNSITSAMCLAHKSSADSLVAWDRTAPRDVAHRKCQCTDDQCPGAVHRSEDPTRSPVLRMSANAPPRYNSCPFTSTAYDAVLTSNAPTENAVPYLDAWLALDDTSQMLFAEHNTPSARTALEKFAGKQWRLLSDYDSVCDAAQPRVTGGKTLHNILTLNEVNAADVCVRHVRSHHSACFCGTDFKNAMLVMATKGMSIEYLMATLKKNIVHNMKCGGCTRKAHVDEESADNPFHLISMLMELDTKSDAQHGYGCQCLFEAFVRQRCTKQINITMMPLPFNAVYRNFGDWILDVRSPMMRGLAAAQASVTRGQRGLVVGSYNINYDRSADVDTAIVENADLSRRMMLSLGPFEARRAADGTVMFRAMNSHLLDHDFERFAEKNTNTRVRRFGDVLSERLSLTDHAAVVAECRRMYNLPPHFKSLTEVVLHLGLLNKAAVWHYDWMPPVVFWLMQLATTDLADIERRARTLFDYERSAAMVDDESRVIVECSCTNNWRLATARIASVLLACIDSAEKFKMSVVRMAWLMAIIHLLADLEKRLARELDMRRTAALQEIVAVAPPAPKAQRAHKPRPAKAAPQQAPAKISAPPRRVKDSELRPATERADPNDKNWSTVLANGRIMPPEKPKFLTLAEYICRESKLDFFNLALDAHVPYTGLASARW